MKQFAKKMGFLMLIALCGCANIFQGGVLEQGFYYKPMKKPSPSMLVAYRFAKSEFKLDEPIVFEVFVGSFFSHSFLEKYLGSSEARIVLQDNKLFNFYQKVIEGFFYDENNIIPSLDAYEKINYNYSTEVSFASTDLVDDKGRIGVCGMNYFINPLDGSEGGHSGACQSLYYQKQDDKIKFHK